MTTTRDPVSMPDFFELVNAIEEPTMWEVIADQMLNSADSALRRVGAEIDNKRREAPKEYGAIMGSISENIQFLSIPQVRDTLSGSDFSTEDLSNKDCTVYMMNPAEFGALLAPMQRSIFESTTIYKNRNPSSPTVHMLIDEAAQLGNFEALLRTHTYGRGMRIRGWSFWQDPGQIARNFGPTALSSFTGSSQSRQFIGTRDYETAKLGSDMLGQQTLEYDDQPRQELARRQRMQAISSFLDGDNPVDAGMAYAQYDRAAKFRTKQARALMAPDEFLRLPEDLQVLLISGGSLKPILANKYAYYTRPEMAGAYMPNPYHPPYDRVPITGHSRQWARVIRERVPTRYEHLPQYQSGEWAYIEGFRPE